VLARQITERSDVRQPRTKSPPEPDALEIATDQAIAACDGDLRHREGADCRERFARGRIEGRVRRRL
jgi:hypothetical protein